MAWTETSTISFANGPSLFIVTYVSVTKVTRCHLCIHIHVEYIHPVSTYITNEYESDESDNIKILRMQRHSPSSWLTSPFFPPLMKSAVLIVESPGSLRSTLSTLLLCVAFGLLRGFLLNCLSLALLFLRGILGFWPPRLAPFLMHNMGEKTQPFLPF